MVSTKRQCGLIVNPNTVAVSCAISPDAVCGLPDDVAALSDNGHD